MAMNPAMASIRKPIGMSMDFLIEFEQNISPEDKNKIYQGLLTHNIEETGLPLEDIPSKRFAFVVKQNGFIQAGLIGSVSYTSAFFDMLWVEKSLRKIGLGLELLQRGEEYAKGNNCNIVFLNTLTPANVKFYEKAGYKLEFERPGYLGKHAMRYFRKAL
jgi:GNAT superfamily N-acetyltransferase